MRSRPKSAVNRLLAALPPEEFRRLISHAEEIPFEIEYLFYEAKEPIESVYFILEGLASIVTPLKEGESVEVLLVGPEGLVGFAAMDSAGYTVPTRAIGQIAGRALKFSAATVREEFNRGGALQKNLLHYFQFAFVQVSQNASCNRMHDLEARLARWLLMVRDRQNSNTFKLTHEFLAQMLGTRRSSVTLAAGVLQRSGLIHYRRGEIEILEPNELQSASCECYEHIRESWDRLRTQY